MLALCDIILKSVWGETYELACLAQPELLVLQAGEYQMEVVAFGLDALAIKRISMQFLGFLRRGSFEHPYLTYQGIQTAGEKRLAGP